jgi:hypothetical protein
MRKITTAVGTVGAAALIATLGATGSAFASHLINSGDIKDNSIRSHDIHDGTIKQEDLSGALQTGVTGPMGPKGDSGLKGAYYSVAYYDAGDVNSGAVASAACKATTDVAISGGVQVTGLNDEPLSHNTPVSSSFPGRMDWSTYTPKANRLDGWIVQFAGDIENPPLKTKVWALCVPGANIPVEQTYTESAD